jgi:tetratricopeptide (TPR) repeat protein
MSNFSDQWDPCVEAGRRAYEMGSYQEAEEILTSVLNKFEEEEHRRDMSFVTLLVAYARVKRETNEFSDALSLYYRALSMLNSPHTLQKATSILILQEIAFSFCLMGKIGQAREKEKRILSLIDELFGFDSQAADDCTVRLACLSWVMNDMDSASVYLRRHLSFARKSSSQTGNSLASSIILLAHCLYRIGNYSEAESLFEEALAILASDSSLQKQYSYVSNELGMSVCAQGRYEEARHICKKAAEERQAHQCEESSESESDTLNNLADVYCSKGMFEIAQAFCRNADSLRWEAPLEDTGACLALYSQLLKHIGAEPTTSRIDRRARELENAA